MALLYSNENFPLRVVEILRTLGHDVLTIQEAGYANQATSDDDVLEMATAQERTVLTLNRRDFIRLHRSVPEHAGIIICTQDADIEGQAERIHQKIAATQTLAGELIRVNRPPK